MGFFSEIRKVLFGVKSVSKSAAEKAFEAGKDATSSALDKSGEMIDKAKDKVEDIGGDVLETAENLWEKAVDVVEDVGEKVMDKAGDVIETVQDKVEDVGEKVLDKTSNVISEIKEKGEEGIDKAAEVFDQVKDKAGNFGEKIMEKSEDIVESVKNTADDATDVVSDKFSSAKEFVKDKHEELFDMPDEVELDTPASSTDQDVLDQAGDKIADLGSAVLEGKSELADKAKDAVENLGEKLDETLQKAEALAKQEASQPEYKAPSELLEKDLLEDKDDFFKKAEAFADGRYEEVTDPFADPKPKIVSTPQEVDTEPTKTPSEPLAGFEDLDGDGNEIVDDALIISSEEE